MDNTDLRKDEADVHRLAAARAERGHANVGEGDGGGVVDGGRAAAAFAGARLRGCNGV